MDGFDEVYRRLNTAQRQAVDAVDGPVLVIAGPGTGKTQLLSARVANILRVTDTPAQNILCLTFTESGADNMRERLTRFIGQAAYDVNIGTYHSFGGDLIRRYPEYFTATRLQNPVDDLGKREIMAAITDNMGYNNPLKQTRHHLGDLMSTISEVKRALLTPEDLRDIARENLAFVHETTAGLQEIFEPFTTMPRSLDKAMPYFTKTLAVLSSYRSETNQSASPYGSLAATAAAELSEAIEAANASSKTGPLTVWKNNWLARDANNHFIMSGELENLRIRALATVLEQYQSALEEQGLYDFDDMILRAIEVLEKHSELRYSLQEKYLYLLLDEFQDTNAAQLKLVELLTNNPVNEGRPNVMAVGDDDQAIYAFQGAQYSNMRDFYNMYRDVLVVNLTENYRSHENILLTAANVAAQIESRLSGSFEGLSKTLQAANSSITSGIVERRDFLSPVAERHWISQKIKSLIDSGIAPHEIAVLAPKHKYLETLVPYLNELNIPVRYEKRENILDAPVVRQLITMGQLILALEANNQALANHFWPQVLSYDFWRIPVSEIWQISWRVSDANRGNSGSTSWSAELLASPAGKSPAMLILALASKVHTETLETLLDMMIGNTPVATHDTTMPEVLSPLRSFYMSPEVQEKDPELFYETVSHITVLRARLQDYQRGVEPTLNLRDLLRFVALYDDAEQQLINTSPYSQQADAVQLMTVFKSKGLEYAHVFLPSSADDVWGSSSRDNSNKLTLPSNLQPIRHAGASDDERLRILFVAITRARQGLYMTNAIQNYNGKPTKRLKYYDEQQDDEGFQALVLPEATRRVISDDTTAPELSLLEIDWRARHIHALKDVSLQGLLHDRIEHYTVSPTHLTDFINLEYAGPELFFFKTILRFPEVPIPDAQFGTAIHETLQWIQYRLNELGSMPAARDAIDYFKVRMASKRLTEHRTALEIERGSRALNQWIKQRSHIMHPGDVAEKSFHNEGIFVGDVHMAGQIDRLEIDKESKTITVVDYKTGKPYERWASDPKLYRYRLQLTCYKLLIENSLTYRGYSVPTGRLEFIEPDDKGRTHFLEMKFSEEDIDRAKKLLQALWQHVKSLDFPDISSYPESLTGIKQFEQDLLEGKI